MSDESVETDGRPGGGALEAVRREAAAYRHGEHRPLGSFTGIMAGYAAAVSLGAVAARRRGLPERIAASDLGLVAVATHKLSRVLAKDPVTSPVRAPFASFAGTSGEAELAEEVRETTDWRKAVGELVTCPFCVGQWVATALIFGLVVAPRRTRVVASALTSLAGADFLHIAYALSEERLQQQ